MVSADDILEPEQQQLLVQLARAHLAERAEFVVVRTDRAGFIRHSKLSDPSLNEGDLLALERHGFIERTQTDARGRAQMFSVTRKGVRLADALSGMPEALAELRSPQEIRERSASSETVARTTAESIQLQSIEVVRAILTRMRDTESDPARRGLADAVSSYMDVLEAFVRGKTEDRATVESIVRSLWHLVRWLARNAATQALADALRDVLRDFLG